MFKVSSESELLDSFRELDRAEISLPESQRYPLFVPDYLAWLEPSGHRVYLLFKARPDRPPVGIVFRRNQGAGPTATMCEWCQSVRSGSNVSLLTATASSKRTVGIYLCNDLSCREKALAPPGASDVPQNSHGRERVRRILKKMSDFAFQNLF